MSGVSRVRAFMAIALAGAAVYFFVLDGIAAAVYWDVAVAAMLAFGFVTVSRLDRNRAAWTVILIGQACFLIGDVCFTVLEHVFHSEAYPNVGDIFYVGGYPFIAIGLTMLLRSRASSPRCRWSDRRLHRRHQRWCAAVGVLRRADRVRSHHAACSSD